MRLSTRPAPRGAAAHTPRARHRRCPARAAAVESAPPAAKASACSSLHATAPLPLLFPFDPLPPSIRPTAIATLAPGLTTFTSPFKASPISALSAENRMSAVTVEGGGSGGPTTSSAGPFLALFNPLTPTQAVLDGLADLGTPVRAIVIPSTSPEHWVGAAGMAAAFPDASILAPPGFFSHGPGGGRVGGRLGALKEASSVLDAAHAEGRAQEMVFGEDAACSLWGGQVQAAVFPGKGGFCEVAFRLAASRTVLTADLAFGLLPSDLAATPGANWLDGALARLAGIFGRLGCATWPVVRASPTEAAAFVRVLDGWVADGGVEWVVPAHLSAPWGGEALAGAFAFVKR